jgi:hypothetical protein
LRKIFETVVAGWKVFDKSERTEGTFSRSDFAYDPEANLHVCPGGKELKKYHRPFSKPRDGVTKARTLIYFARKARLRRLHT